MLLHVVSVFQNGTECLPIYGTYKNVKFFMRILIQLLYLWY